MKKNLLAGCLMLGAFLAWQAVELKDYVQKEKRPPAWDQAVHMEIALDYRQAVREGRWKDVWTLPPKPGMPPFPPLYHLAAMFAYDLDPSNPAGAALWLNWAYLALLCVCVFGIALEFGLGEKAWAVALAFSSAPVILALCHTQLLDLAVAAWVAAAYWAYIRSERFSRWPGAVAFGLIHAIGMLHKWSFFSYFLPVYWEALLAYDLPETRPQTLTCAAVALLGFMPWYLIQLPLLLPRLVQASSDFAVPVWKGDAFLSYLYQMPAHLGAPLFFFGLIGLLFPLAPRRTRERKLLHRWFVLSYLFWAVVPNRQIRFLLPGLAGFGILACAPWPRGFLWLLAAFQLFTAANYTAGWLPSQALGPWDAVLLFPSGRPSGEGWPIEAILRKARTLPPADAPFSNLTLAANDERFNGPTFTWLAKWRDMKDLRIRGVNRRLCEFSRFVVLKTGSPGPPGVVEGLPEAAKIIQDPNGWFARAYREAGRWPLPDRSQAVLYELRPLERPPFPRGPWFIDRFASGPFAAKNLKIELGDWVPKKSAYRLASAEAGEAQLRGLELSRLAVEMEDLEAVPAGGAPLERPWEDVRLLKMRTLRIKSLEVAGEALKHFLESRVPGLRVARVDIAGDIRILAKYKRIPLDAALSIRLDGLRRKLVFELVGAKLGPLGLTPKLLGRLRKFEAPLDPNPETPFAIELAGLTLKDGRLTVP